MPRDEMNPTQWPKFEHVGFWYANHCQQRIMDVSTPAILIQRWWRQRSKPRKNQKLYPIIRKGRFYTVKDCVARLGTNDEALSRAFRAYEKLDGTNFGVRCDGAMFGRRLRISGGSYQRVPLVDAIPTGAQVLAVKEAMLGPDWQDGIELISYGELMCNPRKFDYSERGMGRKFYCFGAMLRYPEEATDEEVTIVQKMLRKRGFAPMVHARSGRVVLNHNLQGLLKHQGISCVPMMEEGPLRDLCLRMKARLMKDDMEGVVLTGEEGSLFKWKTSIKDESRTHAMLSTLLWEHSPSVLELAGIDMALVQCLIDVATEKPATAQAKKGRTNKPKRATQEKAPYDDATLEAAMLSAMTKYDVLEVYFQRGDRATIISLLNKELTEDLAATAPDQIKCVGAAVGKKVGHAFGQWKKAQTRT